MMLYSADTNFLLRCLLRDNESQYKKCKELLSLAKSDKCEISVISEVIPEVEYVLRKFYKVDRRTIAGDLLSIVKMKYLNVEKKDLWPWAIRIYSKRNVDLVDALLYVQATSKGLKIISFDKDFSKLKKYDRQNTSTN